MRSKTDDFDSGARAPAAPANARELPAPRVQTPFSAIVQRTTADPRSLTRAEVAQLQRTIGNAAVAQMSTKAARRPNPTGLPDGLKAGVEKLSGLAMDDVRVHYNSPSPARLQALAYAQSPDIHLAPGQEKHLPHEAWHVVQQKQGRVQPTLQMKDVAINDEDALEREADEMGDKAAQAEHGLLAAGSSRTQPRQYSSIDFRSAPVQRVPVRTSGDARLAVRNHFTRTGDLDEDGRTQLDNLVGATNVVELGLTDVGLLFRNGLTVPQLAYITGPLTMLQLQTVFGRYPTIYVGIYRRLAMLHNNVLTDLVDRPPPVAPTPQQINVGYGNYLAGPHPPGAYAANLHQNFTQGFINGHYHDYATGQWRSLQDAYEDYALRSAIFNLRLDQFAARMYGGDNYDEGTHQIVAVPGWAANPQRAQLELALIGGLPAVAINYGAGVDQAIAILAANQVLAAQVIGRLAAGAEQAAGMRNLVNYLLVTPHATTLQYVDTYQVNLINVLRDDRRLNPVRAAAWENALLAGMILQAPLVVHLRAHFQDLLNLRTHLFAHDGNNAPNFVAPMGFIARVILENAPQLGETLNHLDAVLLAAPHDDDAALPFGARAGGLRGHFKKHVLGLEGNTDLIEPQHWIVDLNLVPGRLEYQHFGVVPPMWVVDEIFQQADRSANDTVADGPRMISLIKRGQLGGADNVAQQFENDYHAYISHRFDAPTGKYLYIDGARVKINAYQGDTFIVAGFENGIFDFSSGYKPYASGDARTKWQAEYEDRLWDI